MEAVYRLRQMVGRMAHIAEVKVRIEEADQDEVIVSPDAFVWRREVYGPDAVITSNDDHLLVAEAVAGVHHALDHLPVRSAGYRVTLTKIQETPVDTWPGDMLVAAANAVLQALGSTGSTYTGRWYGRSRPASITTLAVVRQSVRSSLANCTCRTSSQR